MRPALVAADAAMAVPPDAGQHFAGAAAVAFAPGARASIPLALPKVEQFLVGMRVTVPREARRGDVLRADLLQRDSSGRIAGGYAIEIHVK